MLLSLGFYKLGKSHATLCQLEHLEIVPRLTSCVSMQEDKADSTKTVGHCQTFLCMYCQEGKVEVQLDKVKVVSTTGECQVHTHPVLLMVNLAFCPGQYQVYCTESWDTKLIWYQHVFNYFVIYWNESVV